MFPLVTRFRSTKTLAKWICWLKTLWKDSVIQRQKSFQLGSDGFLARSYQWARYGSIQWNNLFSLPRVRVFSGNELNAYFIKWRYYIKIENILQSFADYARWFSLVCVSFISRSYRRRTVKEFCNFAWRVRKREISRMSRQQERLSLLRGNNPDFLSERSNPLETVRNMARLWKHRRYSLVPIKLRNASKD